MYVFVLPFGVINDDDNIFLFFLDIWTLLIKISKGVVLGPDMFGQFS